MDTSQKSLKGLALLKPLATVSGNIYHHGDPSNTVIIAKHGKQPKHLSTVRRINKIRTFSALEDRTAVKINELQLQGPSLIQRKNVD